ncbi:OmpA family protein [Vibrio coralliilyticus]|uniref:OmpA family protein n=1 Tax=Vibrio coralliilyticus TaxID=190893 RepID=UPI002FD48BED
MNKSTIYTTVIALAFSAATYAEDIYSYRETPLANQLSDLYDDDKDGVINARDLCPDTPLGANIDNDGCGTYVKSEEEMDLHILFENDSSDIQPVFLTQIREMADFLEVYPSTSIELQGYASKVGNRTHNMELSKERAQEVESALINNGVSHTRIKIVGFGDTNLDDLGDDEITHAKNRKVVATVVGHKGNFKKEWTIFTKKSR